MRTVVFALSAIIVITFSHLCYTAEPEMSSGQLLYVPAYSHIYSGDHENKFLLSVTLSIRNTDTKYSMQVTSVAYYNSKGKIIRTYLKKPLSLKPLETVRYVVATNDNRGGSGASFLVRWNAKRRISVPIVESVMIGTQYQQGVSFTSRGQAINDYSKNKSAQP